MLPRGDGTGPMGMGPMTGRAAGYCAGFAVPGYMNPMVGFGFGRGRGRGFRRMYYLTGLPGWARFGYPAYGPAYGPMYGGTNVPTDETIADEKELLSKQVEFLEDQLKQMKKRLKDLEEEIKSDEETE